MQAFTFHRRSFDSHNVLESNFVPLSRNGNRLRGLALIPRSTAPRVTATRDGPNNLFGPFGFLKAGQVRNGVQFLIKGAGRNILFPRCSWVSVLEVLGCFLASPQAFGPNPRRFVANSRGFGPGHRGSGASLPRFHSNPQGFGARPRGFGPSPGEFGPSPRGQELTPATQHRL